VANLPLSARLNGNDDDLRHSNSNRRLPRHLNGDSTMTTTQSQMLAAVTALLPQRWRRDGARGRQYLPSGPRCAACRGRPDPVRLVRRHNPGTDELAKPAAVRRPGLAHPPRSRMRSRCSHNGTARSCAPRATACALTADEMAMPQNLTSRRNAWTMRIG
jgi:hypothetical protein